ncbi:hypothetical protein, partial [Pseudomonas viridiflava]|uniref:hypothetical protein n=1 Tax=Pseudomonas viridiflava TaxID=33069 RepID=UPI00197EA1E8
YTQLSLPTKSLFYANRPHQFLEIACPNQTTNFNTKILSRQFCFFCCQKKKGLSGQDKMDTFKLEE